MTTLSNSIIKIRRLIRDEDSQTLTSDTPILNLIGRVQQEFARDTFCLVKVKEMLAPPEITYAFTFAWEEGYLSQYDSFRPFIGDENYSATQPFELANDYDIDGQGYTLTCGDDLCSVEAQHIVPLFPGKDYFRPQALFWDYKALEQKSFQSIKRAFDDGWHFRSTEVDYFSHVEDLARKGIVTRGVTYEKPDLADVNIVPNPNMEVDEEWAASGSSTYEVSQEQAYEGESSFKVIITAGNTGGLVSGFFDTVTGEIYTYSFYIYPLTYASIYVVIKKGSNGTSDIYGLSHSLTLNAWNKVELTVREVEGGSSGRILFWATQENTFYIDKVKGTKSSYGRRNLLDKPMRSDVFIICYKAVPDRPSASSESYEIPEPFVKYVEYRVASRLLRSYYALRDLERATHFEFRYKLGVSLTKKVLAKQAKKAGRGFKGLIGNGSRRKPYPRLPDHYPGLRLR